MINVPWIISISTPKHGMTKLIKRMTKLKLGGKQRVDNIEFCRILRNLMVTNDVSAYTISKVAGVSKTTINSWLAGTHSPRVETAGIVLGYFGLKFQVVSKQ